MGAKEGKPSEFVVLGQKKSGGMNVKVKEVQHRGGKRDTTSTSGRGKSRRKKRWKTKGDGGVGEGHCKKPNTRGNRKERGKKGSKGEVIIGTVLG